MHIDAKSYADSRVNYTGDAMLKYRVFVVLFIVSVVALFGGLFAGIIPLVILGAVMLLLLFVIRRTFIPVQRDDEP